MSTATIDDYPAAYEHFAGRATSDATRRAYAKLMTAAAKRPHVSEATMDRLRTRWNLCQLEDAGIVRYWNRENGYTRVDARGSRGARAYRSTRELEAFVHGAMAALDA
jgi:hypothetical protein